VVGESSLTHPEVKARIAKDAEDARFNPGLASGDGSRESEGHRRVRGSLLQVALDVAGAPVDWVP
jgi:hypothetical protein